MNKLKDRLTLFYVGYFSVLGRTSSILVIWCLSIDDENELSDENCSFERAGIGSTSEQFPWRGAI